MARDSIRRSSWRGVLGAILIGAATFAVGPTLVSADNGNPSNGNPSNWWPDSNKNPAVSVQVNVVSRPDGVYVEISAKETVPGTQSSPPSSGGTAPAAASTPVPTGNQPGDPGGTVSTSGSSQGKTWTDDTGIYQQTPDGHLYYLTIPNLSNAIDWKDQLAQHPNQMPYVLYVDNQLQGIVWIPESGNVQLGSPPAQVSVPPAPPAGNGSSTDPYQVALSLLDRVPLPNIQIMENPGLGLVNLPGWFWVDGYDGKPFGTSQTVTIPPAVGPDVPFSQVPADDPRRQSTSFTVSVQVSPTSYEWSFGDGATLVTQSLGQAYPAQSDIAHTYQFSSLKTPNGFPIQVTVIFAAQYQVNGGAPQGLQSISHTYSASYPVQEAQALLSSH